MSKTKTVALIAVATALLLYTLVGTGTRVDQIKQQVPAAMEARGWRILRYEGFQYGSWGRHGGKVWYHVCNADNPSIQYRVYVCLWGGELQFYYDAPESVSRFVYEH